jgi:hypothetical protein
MWVSPGVAPADIDRIQPATIGNDPVNRRAAD